MRERFFVSRHRIWQIATDVALVALALYLSYLLRFDFAVPRVFAHQLRWVIVPVVVARCSSSWPSASTTSGGATRACAIWSRSFWRTLTAVALGMLVAEYVADKVQPTILGYWHNDVTAHRLPWSVLALDWLLTFGLLGGARLLARVIWEAALAPGLEPRPQEGAGRGRRRRRRARRARDAKDAPDPLSPGGFRRRRPEEEEPAHPRRAGRRHHAPPARPDRRVRGRRGHHRHAVGRRPR